jgi:hypothetical protein
MAGIWEQAQQTCELGLEFGNKLNNLVNYGRNLATSSTNLRITATIWQQAQQTCEIMATIWQHTQ